MSRRPIGGYCKHNVPGGLWCDECDGDGSFSRRTVWKYSLAIVDLQSVAMPEGAEILSVQMQGETLCLWALVNADAPKHRRVIEILGTGNPAPDAKRRYISTTQMHGGSLVWHVFERE